MKKLTNRLYRSRRIDNREWVYGSLIIDEECGYYCILSDDKSYIEYPYLDSELGTIDGRAIPIDPKYIGVYIGIKDKNGRKIFENDVVKTKYGRKCVVVWVSYPGFIGWDLIPVDDISPDNVPDGYDIWRPENLEVCTKDA